MKEITRIHLASNPYNIEIDAKKELEKYLRAIEKALGADNDTLREIEARMTELLTERSVVGEKVITHDDVIAVEERLGAPGEFAEGAVPGAGEKRLMRDTQRSMIGGVMSGLAAYTGVDVVWWRLLAVVLAFVSFGTVAILYVVLWIVMPAAKTAAERLQMRGQQPTLENIQDEVAIEIPDTPTAQKPLVIVLRALGVIGFISAAAGGVALTIFATLGVSPVWLAYDWLANTWLVVAFGLCVVSGLLFVALMSVAAYSAGVWRISKSLIAAAIAITVAGLVTFGAAVGTGIYGVGVLQRTVEQHTKKVRTDLPSLQGATELRVAKVGVNIEYHVTDQQPYAVVESLLPRGDKPAEVAVTRDGAVATLSAKGLQDEACDNLFGLCGNDRMSIRVYGPAVSRLAADKSSVSYTTISQENLNLAQNDDSVVSLHGRIATVDATLSSISRLRADDATVDTAKITMDQQASVSFGVLQNLAVNVPQACDANRMNSVEYEHALSVTVNGEVVKSLQENGCVMLPSLGNKERAE